MNISYLLYQAEHQRSATEQREADVQAGEMAAAIARAGRSLRHAIMGTGDARRGNQRPAAATAACAVPRPR
jgi:hypothetical protein